jgi:uridine phosphorylase
MKTISDTDLILNPDGSIYHLGLLPEDIGDTVITVGDPERVGQVSKYFDKVEVRKGNREFLTHTGYISNKRISVISTGIGTDNIDIVLNEIDALVNIDFGRRVPKDSITSLDIIRIGTSGTIQPDISTGSIVISEFAVGFDSLMNYYIHQVDGKERELQDAIHSYLHHIKLKPYVTSASPGLVDKFGNALKGITVTSPGFYAPQGREMRAKGAIPNFIQLLSSFRLNDLQLTNLEMETAGIYGLAKTLNHNALSVNCILANRVTNVFSTNPAGQIDKTIEYVLINL